MALPEDQGEREWRWRALTRRRHIQGIDDQRLNARASWVSLPEAEREHVLGFSVDGDVDLIDLGRKTGERRRTVDGARAISTHPEGQTLKRRSGVEARRRARRIASAGCERKQQSRAGDRES